MGLIDIEIDGLTRSIVEVATNASLNTTIAWWSEMKPSQRKLAAWQFNWRKEADQGRDVAALSIRGDMAVQGLIAMETDVDHVYVHLIESAPHNISRAKRYAGVPGNLFAFACLRSRQLGFEGVIAFTAKSKLIEHYHKTLGATRLGSSQRMIVEPIAADALIERYFQEPDQWPR